MPDAFDALPWRQRHAVTDAVRTRTTETLGHDLEDIVRWTIDAYADIVQDALVDEMVAQTIDSECEASYNSGYADGKADATEAVSR